MVVGEVEKHLLSCIRARARVGAESFTCLDSTRMRHALSWIRYAQLTSFTSFLLPSSVSRNPSK